MGYPDDQYAWAALLNLSGLIDGADEISEALFGFASPNGALLVVNSNSRHLPTQGRGLPPNPAPQVRADLASLRELEQQFGPGEFRGVTHVYLDEVPKSDLSALSVGNIKRSDWAAGSKLSTHSEVRTLA